MLVPEARAKQLLRRVLQTAASSKCPARVRLSLKGQWSIESAWTSPFYAASGKQAQGSESFNLPIYSVDPLFARAVACQHFPDMTVGARSRFTQVPVGQRLHCSL